MVFKAIDGNGKIIDNMTGVVPIIKEYEKGILRTIGTGFYISRYGLVMTAKHVIEGLKSKDNISLTSCYICHTMDNNSLNLRKIISASFLENVDIGIIQADNYCHKYPNDPLMNYRVQLCSKIPNKNEALPEHVRDFHPLDFLRNFIYSKNFYYICHSGRTTKAKCKWG